MDSYNAVINLESCLVSSQESVPPVLYFSHQSLTLYVLKLVSETSAVCPRKFRWVLEVLGWLVRWLSWMSFRTFSNSMHQFLTFCTLLHHLTPLMVGSLFPCQKYISPIKTESQVSTAALIARQLISWRASDLLKDLGLVLRVTLQQVLLPTKN